MVVKANPNLAKYSPNIKISSGGSVAEIFIDIHIMNPFDKTIDAALITAKIVTNVSFSVNENFQLTGEINNLDIQALEFEPYFKTPSSKFGLNTKLMFGKNIIESYANGFLDKGYKLPLP